ncbi:hypothetical protein F4775DRAFT_588412 [Biscogniauxia sp. FL1348]|nr:hypothetical protein F4775DRAFT_588412 [Biscogniauxia sp. FL1348]
MQFTTIFATIATLALGANAAVLPRDGARLAQFRIFGEEGCSALNYGFWTVDESDTNTCKGLNQPDGTVVKSIELEVMNFPAADGCTFFIYTDTACGAGRRALGGSNVGSCNNPLQEGETWGSWQFYCPTGAA